MRDAQHRARIGGRREQADDPQLAMQGALLVVGLDADIVEIDAAMDDRLAVRLGDDQRIGSMQKRPDLGRRGHALRPAPQHRHVRIGENAEPLAVVPPQRAAPGAADIAELAHPEEREIVVTQPFEEGDRLGDRIPVERYRGVAKLRDRVVQAGQHRLPVADRCPHLAKHRAQPVAEFGCLGRGQQPDMDVDDAHAVGALDPRRAALARISSTPDLPCLTVDDGMGDQDGFAGRAGYLAQHGIEQERHVVVDDRDDGHRAAVANDPRVDVDGDHAVALPVFRDGRAGQCGGPLEHRRLVGGEILGRRPAEEEGGEARLFAGRSRPKAACGCAWMPR